ncbi:unnamed protein product [Camellia sinensis]
MKSLLELDHELEFDCEVYPLGLLPNAGVVVANSQLLKLKLYCIAYSDMFFSMSANKNQISVPKHGTNSSLLDKICDLIKKFPEYFDVVVSVARKTDGQHWADLFSAAGRSTKMVQVAGNKCLVSDMGTSCRSVYVTKTTTYVLKKLVFLEGPAVSQYCALHLLQAALDESLYELDGKLRYRRQSFDSRTSNGHTTGSVRCGISFGSYVLCQVQRANSHPSHSFKTIRGSF